jgi:hypothetical protein
VLPGATAVAVNVAVTSPTGAPRQPFGSCRLGSGQTAPRTRAAVSSSVAGRIA